MDNSKDKDFLLFHYQQATLQYLKYGNGPQVMLCFHGFGLTCEMFKGFEEALSKEYTVYSFDLFFHGKSEWKNGEEPITEAFWTQLIEQFIKEKNISEFSLLAYSIGARSVWSIAQRLPEKVKGIVAIAPDGITNSFWYRLATGTVFSRFLFKELLSTRTYINTFLNIGKSIFIMPAITVRFAKSQLRTARQRSKVYNTWVVYRLLKANNSLLADAINKHNISLTIYIGEYDKVISHKMIQPLTKKINTKNIHVLKAGHLNLVNKVKEEMNSKSR